MKRLEGEQELLRPQLIKAYIDGSKATGRKTVVLDDATTCNAPVFYESNRCWMECNTCVTKEEIEQARSTVLNERILVKYVNFLISGLNEYAAQRRLTENNFQGE